MPRAHSSITPEPSSPTSTSSRDGSDGNSRKRQLLDDLAPGGRRSKAQKRDTAKSLFGSQARHIRRIIDLCSGIGDLLVRGLYLQNPDNSDALLNPEDARTKTSFDMLLEQIPDLKEQLLSLTGHADQFQYFCALLSESANQARTEDVSALKSDILHLVNADSSPIVPYLSPLEKTKSGRGFSHPVLGGLLCPADYDWSNEEVQRALKGLTVSSDYIASSDLFPAFLYAEDQEYDCDDPQKGLLRSTFLLRAYKYIFTSPTSAMSGGSSRSTRKGNAAIHKQTKVTPRSIAYIAVLVYYSISSAECWPTTFAIGDFNLQEFYWRLVELFDDAGAWGEETLAWWDLKVFGTKTAAAPSTGVPTPAGRLSTMERIRAKRAAAAAAAAD